MLVLAALAVSCGELKEANKFVEEGNAAVKEAEKYAQEADAKIGQMETGLASFPEGREQLQGTSQEAIGLLDKSVAKLREAEKKFADGSQKDIDAALKEYLTVKSQEFGKHADHFEALKGIPQAVTDASITDREALNAKFSQVMTRVQQLEKEWTDLSTRADKIYQENKSKFAS